MTTGNCLQYYDISWRQLGFHYFPLCILKGHPCGQHPLDFPYPVAAPDFSFFVGGCNLFLYCLT